jgi:hypothetical protein
MMLEFFEGLEVNSIKPLATHDSSFGIGILFNPFMLECLFSLEASLWFADETSDKVFGLVRDLQPLLTFKFKFTFNYSPQDFLIILSIERRIAA